jgi:hypothetical protein
VKHPQLQTYQKPPRAASLVQIFDAMGVLLRARQAKARSAGVRIGFVIEGGGGQWVADLGMADVRGGPLSREADEREDVTVIIEGREDALLRLLNGEPCDEAIATGALRVAGDLGALKDLIALLR